MREPDEGDHDADEQPPYVELIGPPIAIPNPNRVRHPDRIEMIVNETAKFENPLIPRLSSCGVAELSGAGQRRTFDAPVPGRLLPCRIRHRPSADSFPLEGGACGCAYSKPRVDACQTAFDLAMGKPD
jgi:hypothetical protein